MGQGYSVLSAGVGVFPLIKSPHCRHLSRLQPPALSICAAEARRDLWWCKKTSSIPASTLFVRLMIIWLSELQQSLETLELLDVFSFWIGIKLEKKENLNV